MKNRFVFFALLMVGAAMVAGCSRPSLVGRWTMQDAQSAGGISELVVDFKDGGVFAAEAKAGTGPFTVKGSAKGTWTLAGEKLSVKIDSTDFKNLPEEFRELAESEINRQASRLTGTFRWQSPNSFTVGEQDYSATFERVNR